MALKKIRGLVFALAAIALFLATVMPRIDINPSAAAATPMVGMTATDGMDCPDCVASPEMMAGCVQATCVGFAVMTGGEHSDVSAVRPAYAITVVALPDGFVSAPPTPPI